MLREHSRLFNRIHLFLDLGLTVISFFLAYLLGKYANFAIKPLHPISYYLFLLYIIVPLWLILLNYYKCYQHIRTKDLFSTVLPFLKVVFAGGIFVMTVLFIFKLQSISRGLILLFLSLNGFLFLMKAISLHYFLHFIRKRGRNYRSLLIVGTGKRSEAFAETIFRHKEWGLKIKGFVNIEPSMARAEFCGVEIVGQIDELPDILSKNQIDEVVFVVPKNRIDMIEDAVVTCEEIGVKVRVACDFFKRSVYVRTHLDMLDDWPLLSFSSSPHYGEVFIAKRAFDFVFSSIVLLFISPVLLIIALAIKLTSRGTVFFRQQRSGLNGRTFELLKFRTMVDGAEGIKPDLEGRNEMSGPVFKFRKDPRITPLGRFLRKFSLDEFPQFINVLKGDMSVVGPRPPIPHEVERYGFSQRRRLSVRPGLTCLWQVNGRNKVADFKDWVSLDLEYIDHWSFLLDIKIILKTIPAVLKGTGV